VRDLLSGEVEAVAGKVGGEQSVSVRSCPEGSYDWAGLRLGFWRSPTAVSGNAASCVLRVYHPGSGSDLWLTGDITREVERQMLAGKVHQGLPVNNGRRIVVAPHHGSKTSSSAPWVGAMAPDHVIYTAGYQHRYGHPHPDVTRRYRQAGARALNTACSGEITIVFTEGGPEIRESRYSTPFWINRAGLARDQCLIP
jgi:competence protein ComEC